jgi:hypothetical protein
MYLWFVMNKSEDLFHKEYGSGTICMDMVLFVVDLCYL